MDKIASKMTFCTPPACRRRALWRSNAATGNRRRSQVIARIEAALRYPVFVKPANLGSSIGISKAQRHGRAGGGADRGGALRPPAADGRSRAARTRDRVQRAGQRRSRSPQCRARSCRRTNSTTMRRSTLTASRGLLIPAPLPPAVTATCARVGCAGLLAIDGAGLARVDFLLNGETSELFINEVNTMPGFTAISMYPKLWEASGIRIPSCGSPDRAGAGAARRQGTLADHLLRALCARRPVGRLKDGQVMAQRRSAKRPKPSEEVPGEAQPPKPPLGDRLAAATADAGGGRCAKSP